MKLMKEAQAVKMGFHLDKRKRRRQHRRAARQLIGAGTLLNAKAPRGSTLYVVAQWHLFQARYL